ncbi:MAG: hypothetical protein SFT81_03945 [Candidatus Caenarcaniphilales bacterium]|nr:hypothetical protein [Candidatus Caenarcaniphilales bacterium]
MSNFIPKAKEESILKPDPTEPTPKSIEVLSGQKSPLVQEQKPLQYKPTLKGTPHTVNYPRTKMIQIDSPLKPINITSSSVIGNQPTAFRAEKQSQQLQQTSSLQSQSSEEILVDCTISLDDESKQCLAESLTRCLKLNQDELEQLIAFLDEVELRRKKQQREKQERRSAQIARKIHATNGGGLYLSENAIVFSQTTADNEDWYQFVTIDKGNGDIEEISQTLNFFNPQHSWILENWLSQQSVSWTVRRSYNLETEQVIFQVSFGFPNQTFLEAEGPSREGAIVSIAEDLLG